MVYLMANVYSDDNAKCMHEGDALRMLFTVSPG